MAITDIVVSGKLFQDDGDPVEGATVQLLETGTTTVEATYTDGTTAAGLWTFTETSLDTTYDVKIASGSTSKRYILWSDEIALKGVDTASLKIRGAASAAALLYFIADAGDDNADIWTVKAADGGAFTFESFISGSSVAHLTITPHATVASSTVAFAGSVTVATSLNPDSADGATIGSASAEWSDLYLADGAVINLGADQDVTLTHYADNGVVVNSTRKIYFEDASNYDQYIGSTGSGVTAIAAPTEIDLTAADIDINGTANISGVLTIQAGIVPDAADGAYLGTSSAEWSDLFLADGAVISLGNDQDVTLTHYADNGILLNSTRKLYFEDGSNYDQSIGSAGSGVTAIAAPTEIDLTAPTVDINASTAFTVDTAGISLDSSGASNLTTSGGALTITSAAAATWTVGGGNLTLDVTGDIALSADGGNVTMDDGTTTIFDFNVDDTTLTIHDDQDTGDKAVITMAQHGALSIVTTDDDAAAADFTIDADGEIVIDAADAAGAIFKIAGTAQLSVIDGAIRPTTDNDIDLGSSNYQFKDAYINGTLEADAITIGGTNVVTGSLITTLGTISGGITSTAAANAFGASDFNEANITNVGDIALDSISADDTDINVAVSDNSATAMTIKQGANAYVIIDTADSSESVSIGTGISGTAITLGHATSETTVADNLTVTGDLTVSGTNQALKSTVVGFVRTVLQGSGDQAITGAGFAPSAAVIFAMVIGGTVASFGFGDDAAGEGHIRKAGSAWAGTSQAVNLNDVGAVMDAVVKTMDADGLTLTWTKTGGGVEVEGVILFIR